MALKRTGKKLQDIFAATKAPAVGLEVAPRRAMGRPPAAEPYQKVTIILFDRHILLLDKAILAIREKTGKVVRRAELVRALVEEAAPSLDPGSKDFDKTVQRLLR